MWVLLTLAGLAALLLFLLCVPLELVFDLEVNGRPKFGLRLVWFFGLFSQEVKKGKKKPKEEKGEVAGRHKPAGGKKKGGDIKPVFKILRTRGLLRQVIRFLRRVITSFRIKELSLNLRLGFDNPADTGLLFAVIGPAMPFVSSSRFHRVSLEPSFDGAVCQGRLHGVVGLQPIRLVPPITGLVFSPSTMRVVKTLVISKWKSRK